MAMSTWDNDTRKQVLALMWEVNKLNNTGRGADKSLAKQRFIETINLALPYINPGNDDKFEATRDYLIGLWRGVNGDTIDVQDGLPELLNYQDAPDKQQNQKKFSKGMAALSIISTIVMAGAGVLLVDLKNEWNPNFTAGPTIAGVLALVAVLGAWGVVGSLVNNVPSKWQEAFGGRRGFNAAIALSLVIGVASTWFLGISSGLTLVLLTLWGVASLRDGQNTARKKDFLIVLAAIVTVITISAIPKQEIDHNFIKTCLPFQHYAFPFGSWNGGGHCEDDGNFILPIMIGVLGVIYSRRWILYPSQVGRVLGLQPLEIWKQWEIGIEQPDPKEWFYDKNSGEYLRVEETNGGLVIYNKKPYLERWNEWRSAGGAEIQKKFLTGCFSVAAIGIALAGYAFTTTDRGGEMAISGIFMAVISGGLALFACTSARRYQKRVGPKPLPPVSQDFGASAAETHTEHPAQDDLTYTPNA